jgi:hypothetical protein
MTSKIIKLLAICAISALVIVSSVFALNQLAANNASDSSPPSSISTATPTKTPSFNSPTNAPTLSPNNPTKPSQTPTSSSPTTTQTPTINPTPTPTMQPTPTPTVQPTPIPTIQPTPDPTIQPTATPIPTPSSTPRPPITVTFDFDTATPPLITSMSTPLSQTKEGISAQFSSPSDPAGFSIQSYSTTFYKLSQFQGNYLNDNKASRDTLEIRFNQSLTSITFTFATFEFDGGPTSQPSYMLLTAYMDSTANQIGTSTARGTWPSGGDAYPQGTLTYNSANGPFNLIRIELPYQGQPGAVDYLIDTITVKTS